jgi:hypothetical protein
MPIAWRFGRATVAVVGAFGRGFVVAVVAIRVIERDFNPKEPTAAKTRSQPALVGL